MNPAARSSSTSVPGVPAGRVPRPALRTGPKKSTISAAIASCGGVGYAVGPASAVP
ncbi:hypothetical protein [Fodinicola feengrottensis]|uniref:hypothetical protein n=1 Tax=Fodinicola feengrottensis TaxID=435914 RepID=UPI002441F154|nr:hypothetical protein [Fodinicola feengrottensis]